MSTAVQVSGAEATFTLRCHSCSHAMGIVPSPMRLVAMFKASIAVRIASAHPEEVRRRCNSCGWVNVFYPPEARQRVEIKAMKDMRQSGPIERAGFTRQGPSMATHSQRSSGHA